MPESDMLKYGALGFGFLVLFVILWLIVRPIILAFVRELREGRKERTEQREQFLDFMQNHAAAQVQALHGVKEGLTEVVVSLRKMNGREQEK